MAGILVGVGAGGAFTVRAVPASDGFIAATKAPSESAYCSEGEVAAVRRVAHPAGLGLMRAAAETMNVELLLK